MYLWTEKAEKRAYAILDYGTRRNEIKAGNVATFCGEPIKTDAAEIWLRRGLIEETGTNPD